MNTEFHTAFIDNYQVFKKFHVQKSVIPGYLIKTLGVDPPDEAKPAPRIKESKQTTKGITVTPGLYLLLRRRRPSRRKKRTAPANRKKQYS